jgi:3-hydroxybutyrate dehydrogenase/3-oxoacyl-[acyl-carrier protein] reductase
MSHSAYSPPISAARSASGVCLRPATAEAMGMEFDEMIAMFASESAIKRPNTVEEIAAVALLLASPEGAGITGAQISVDGGTAQF